MTGIRSARSPGLFAALLFMLALAQSALAQGPGCDGQYVIPPPPRGSTGHYVILTTGRSTEGFLSGSSAPGDDVVHRRSCEGGSRDLTIGQSECPCWVGSGVCVSAPYVCLERPPSCHDDALAVLGCWSWAGSPDLIHVRLRTYYQAPLANASIFVGLAATGVGYGYQGWETAPQGVGVLCVDRVITLPRTAQTYMVQVTILRPANVPFGGAPPVGTFPGGDTENWSLEVAWNSSTGSYETVLRDSTGVIRHSGPCQTGLLGG
jgi:hypothetical protein